MNERNFLAIYRRHQESGLTTKEFCANEGIAESTYYYWFKKTKHKRARQEFIPLVVRAPQQVPSPGYENNPSPVNGSRNCESDNPQITAVTAKTTK